MKETPIIFSTELIPRILDGTKTQTRRVIKPQPDLGLDPFEGYSHIKVGHYHPTKIDKNGEEYPGEEIFGAYTDDGEWGWRCPYGQVGDRLIIKESWATENRYNHLRPSEIPQTATIYYPASITYDPFRMGRKRSARFMCNWMSRARPEITEVRVERLQEITVEDIKAEGISSFTLAKGVLANEPPDSRWQFIELWDSLNAKYGWDTNCWVWALNFKILVEGGGT